MELPLLAGHTVVWVNPAEPPGPCGFGFSDGSQILVECDWRIVSNGRVALAAQDHQQPFGLGEPIDVAREAMALLAGKPVTRASLSNTGDLVLEFDDAIQLQTFTNSSGYESCTLAFANGNKLVVTGGGAIVEFLEGDGAAQQGDEADER